MNRLRRVNLKTQLYSHGLAFRPQFAGGFCHRKRRLDWINLKTPAICSLVDGDLFENGAFRKRWRHARDITAQTSTL